MQFVHLMRTWYRPVSSAGGENETKKQQGHSQLSDKAGALLSLTWRVSSPAACPGLCIPSRRGIVPMACRNPKMGRSWAVNGL